MTTHDLYMSGTGCDNSSLIELGLLEESLGIPIGGHPRTTDSYPPNTLIDDGPYYDLDALRGEESSEYPTGVLSESMGYLPNFDLLRGYFRGDIELTDSERKKARTILLASGAIALTGLAAIGVANGGVIGERITGFFHLVGDLLKDWMY